MNERDKREIQLEATIDAMYDCYTMSRKELSVTNNVLEKADQLMDGLFNQADIRPGLGDLVTIKIEEEG